jgi:hypothetical protein
MPMSESTDGPITSPEQTSLLEDCFDIWFTPSSVFARRRSGGWLGPLLLSSVLLAALLYAAMGTLQGVFDAEVTRAVVDAQAQNPNLTSEQIASMQGVMEKSIQYGGLVFLPIVLIGLGFGVWLVSRIFGGELSLGGGIAVASLAYLPKSLEMLLVIIQGFVIDTSTITGRYQLSWGVARFMQPGDTQGLYNLLGRVDLFTIWVTALVAIGLVHAGKLEKPKAYAGAGILWVLGAVPALLQLVTGK